MSQPTIIRRNVSIHRISGSRKAAATVDPGGYDDYGRKVAWARVGDEYTEAPVCNTRDRK